MLQIKDFVKTFLKVLGKGRGIWDHYKRGRDDIYQQNTWLYDPPRMRLRMTTINTLNLMVGGTVWPSVLK